LLISATHTHGGPGAIQQPPGHALLVGDNYDPRVVKRTIDGIVKAITVAHQNLLPARIAIGQTKMLGVSGNRSYTPHLGDPCPDPQAVDNPSPGNGFVCDPKTDVGALAAHAVDPWLTMIRADRTDGVPLGVWTSFAIHGTVAGGDNLYFTGDNQSSAERLIEAGIAQRAAARGIKQPRDWQIIDADANGSEGDIAPFVAPCDDARDFDKTGQVNPYTCPTDWAQIEWNGIHQAQATLGLYDQLGSQMASDLPLDSRLDVLYMKGDDGTSPVAVFGSGNSCNSIYGDPGSPTPPFDQAPFNQAPFYGGAIPGQGHKCPLLVLTGLGPAWFWMQTMRIGDYAFANIPGEMTVQMARRVRKHILDCPIDCDAKGNQIVHHALVVGLANDYMSYITTPQEYDYQWYEGTFTLWGQQEGPLLQDRFGQLADAMLHGKPVSFQEPPDTSGTQADNVSPLTQARSNAPLTSAPGTVLTKPPTSVKRGQMANFTWVGGQPSAEVVQDQAFVTTQCQVGLKWRSAFSDGSGDSLTDYYRKGVEDHWGTRWDVPLDAPAGGYRFSVSGQAYSGGQVKPYAVDSSAFNVQPSDELTVTAAAPSGGATLVRAAYPKPITPAATPGPIYGPNDVVDSVGRAVEPQDLPRDPNVNFRLRPAGPTSGRVTITVTHANGTSVTGSGTYDPAQKAYVVPVVSQVGDTVSVQTGALADVYGNNNGKAQSVKASGTLPPPVDTGLTLPVAPGLPTPALESRCAAPAKSAIQPVGGGSGAGGQPLAQVDGRAAGSSAAAPSAISSAPAGFALKIGTAALGWLLVMVGVTWISRRRRLTLQGRSLNRA
jgi:neutral ceramidase